MSESVFIKFDAKVHGPFMDTLLPWFKTREYFRLVLDIAPQDVAILNYDPRGEYTDITAIVILIIDGLEDLSLLPRIFETIVSPVCGPVDSVVISKWEIL